MVNESECSKKFKKIADRSTASAKKEIRIAKEYSKLWTNYSAINEIVGERTNNLNSLNLIVRKKTQKVEALKEIQEERDAELKKVQEEIEVLQEKNQDLHNNQPGSDNKNSPVEKLLQMSLIKLCTMTHISDKAPHLIRGFTANTQNSKIFPFEIDLGPKTKTEIEDTLWENVHRSSDHAKEWEALFSSSSE
ncbi:kinetochore protein Spc25-like [Eupeodes corollae]|uniref:kinetochore protein Spc25-like n=1 Tax=Eupeodes corollae TaxID=290404 RepID=UPI0024925A7C|nr:kinetochore protein Spc25-like [Eupeodes corollae]